MKHMVENIKQYAEQIARIIDATEDIKHDRSESDYTKDIARRTAYEAIAELAKGGE